MSRQPSSPLLSPCHAPGDLATRAELQALSTKFDDRFANLELRIDARFTKFEDRIDERFARIDERFTRIDDRFTRVEESIASIAQSLSRLEEKVAHGASKAWVLGGSGGVLLAILGVAWWLLQPYVATMMRIASGSGA
ncbi:MAG: hypothetical protein WBW32_09620 [Luteibacter sp.]